MRIRFVTTTAVALLVGASATYPSVAAQTDPGLPFRGAEPGVRAEQVSKYPWNSSAGRVVPGEIVVVWRAGVPAPARRALTTRLGANPVAATPRLGVDVVRVPAGRSVNAAIRRYQRSPLVRSAEPNRIASVAAAPNDPLFGEQWALDNTGTAPRDGRHRQGARLAHHGNR